MFVRDFRSHHLTRMDLVNGRERCDEAAKLMVDYNANALVVTKSNQFDREEFSGIVEVQHLLECFLNADGKNSKTFISDITPEITYSCNVDDHIQDILALMAQQNLRYIPIRSSGETIGIIGISDIAKFISEQNFLDDAMGDEFEEFEYE